MSRPSRGAPISLPRWLSPSSSIPSSRGLVLVAAALAALAGACGDGATEPAPTPNRAPTPSGSIPPQTVAVGETGTVNVAGYFTDPDGDALTYAAASSQVEIATVAVSGSVVTMTAIGQGVATVTVTATDGGGLSAQQSFTVTVPNRPPEAVGRIEDLDVYVDSLVEVDAAPHFTDPDGDQLEYRAASSDTTRLLVSVSGSLVKVTGVAVGSATVTVTATDAGGLSAQQSFAATVPNRAPVVTDSIPDLDLAVGDSATFDLSEHFLDPDADSLAYAVETSDDDVAAASVAGATLTVRALAKGRTTLRVTATDTGGLAADQSFEVFVPNQAPVVTDSIPPQDLTVGETRSWHGPEHFADPDGDSLTLTAGTTDASVVVALVSGDEFGILAVAPGTATVTFTATDDDGLSATQGIRVISEAPIPVIIMDVEPAVLLEGASATIRGSGFSSVPGNNTVLIDGLAATVTAASSTSLSVIVPYSDCLPPRRAELGVTVGSLGDARTVGVTARTQEDLDLPTGHYRYTYAGNGCLHLPGDAFGGEYLIGVVSTAETPSSLVPVTMTSIVGDPTVVAAQPLVASSEPSRQAAGDVGSFAAMSPMARPTPPSGAATLQRQEVVGGWRDWEREAEMMERNQELVRRLGPMPPSMARARRTQALSASDTLTLFVGSEPNCTSRGQVRAVVRSIGNYAVWLDDIANPSGTFTDAELADLDAFYGANVEEVHDEYFGGLSDVDGNSRVVILMTKEVNRQDDGDLFLGGWVWFADLYPSAECAASNQAEIFYGRVPDPNGVFGRPWTKEQTLEYYPSLLTHEIAHLVQGNAAVFGEAAFTIWELEGGATLSEQLVAYRLFGHGSGQNLGYTAFLQGLGWYSEWVSGLAKFFGWDSDDPSELNRIPKAPEECSWMGRREDGNDGPCRNAFRAVYDVPSMVLRFAMDRWGSGFPGGEQALMRRLTQSPMAGLASLSDVSDWRIEQILADFYIALWLDLNGWDAYGMASWDLYDIWSRFPSSAQLQPYLSTSPEFHGRWNIRAGSTSYLRWVPRGSRGPTSLRVTSATGAPVPSHISVWALRVR